MNKLADKGLKVMNKIIKKQSGLDSKTEIAKCQAWFYQPKRPEKR